jgi:hypothetical protein
MPDPDPRYQGLAEGLRSAGSGSSRSVGSFVLHLVFTVPLLFLGFFENSLITLGSLILVLSGAAYLSGDPYWNLVPAMIGSLLSAACVVALFFAAGDRHGVDILFGLLSLPVFLATGLAWIRVAHHRGAS